LATVLVRPDGHVAWAGEQQLDRYLPEREIRSWLNMSEEQPVFRHSAAVQVA
jgi:hypothetical protein